MLSHRHPIVRTATRIAARAATRAATRTGTRTALLLAALCPLLAAQRPSGEPRHWEHETSDLAVNPRIHFGALENGLRYAWMVNGEPKKRCYLRLHVDVGSLNEEDSQQGMAHVLEHMSFNGSEHFAPGTLVEWFQKHGMAFGADTNASTNFNETVYKLDLPTSDKDTVREGLTMFADVVHGLLLKPEEVKAELGVIDGEERERDSAGFRAGIADLKDEFAGSRAATRIPIGIKELRAQFTSESERAFYSKWYRPENMTVMIVGDLGDLDPTPIIKDLFGSIPAPKDPVPAEADPGPAAPKPGVYNFYSAELPLVTLSAEKLKPWVNRPGDKANALRDLALQYARRMVNLRFEELAKKPDAPFLGASLQEAGGLHVLEGEELSVSCKPDKWEAALASGEQELRRALQYGFRQDELDEVRADALRSLDEAVEREPTRPSSSFVNEIVTAAEEREVVTDAATDRALFKPAIVALTIDACHEALVKAWNEGTLRLSAVGGLDLSASGAVALRKAWEKSGETKVEAPPEVITAAFAYHSAPDAAGKIASRKKVDDLDVHQVQFENGVRLNVKHTDFRERQVLVRARVGEGLLSLPPEKAALGWIGQQAFVASGLEAHSADDLRRLTAGKQVGVSFNMQPDAFVLDQGTTADDLLLQCELTCAYLMHPGWRDEGLRDVQKQLGPLFDSLTHQPTGPVQTQFLHALYAGDPRFGLPPQPELAAVTVDQLKAWLDPQLAEGPLEITIIGDVDPEAAITAAARTFGMLPERKPAPDTSERRKAKLVSGLRQTASIVSEVPSSLIFMEFPTTDGRVALQRRQLSLLGNVLSDRLRVEVREKLGVAYSPQAQSQASEVFPDIGTTLIQVAAAPGTEDKVLAACLGVTDALVKDGVTSEELERQREPILAKVRDQMRENSFWRELLDDSQARPQVLDELRSLDADYRGITTDQLTALAKKYFPREHGSWIVVSPQKAAGAADAPAGAAPADPAAPPKSEGRGAGG